MSDERCRDCGGRHETVEEAKLRNAVAVSLKEAIEEEQTVTITTTRTVLCVATEKVQERIDAALDIAGVPFVACPDPDDEPNPRSTLLVLDSEMYVEMGKPNIITVTVEVGDQLNIPVEQYDPAEQPEWDAVVAEEAQRSDAGVTQP